MPAPRFEYRSFGREFEAAAHRMAELSAPVPRTLGERRSNETYIISRANDHNNTKIRDGKLDIKTHVKTVDGLEQWYPLIKAEFPISATVLEDGVCPALEVMFPRLDREAYTLAEFLVLVEAHPDLQAVSVKKRRIGYLVNETMCEVADVLIDGTRLTTICAESTEIGLLKKTIADVGLVGVENINYPQAIKRVMGMVDKPLAN